MFFRGDDPAKEKPASSKHWQRKALRDGASRAAPDDTVIDADKPVAGMRANIDELIGELPPGGILQTVLGDKIGVEILAHRLKAARAENAALKRSQRTAWRLGGCKYLVGRKTIVLTEPQDEVIEALVELGGAATLDELRERSGRDGPHKLLKTILTSHPEFQPFLAIPAGKAKGGYLAKIAPVTREK